MKLGCIMVAWNHLLVFWSANLSGGIITPAKFWGFGVPYIIVVSSFPDLVSSYLFLLSVLVKPYIIAERFKEVCDPFSFLQFMEKLLDEGTKSPRTIRLAALHLTGLWLLYPRTIKYYIKELKLLTLYGSGTFTLFHNFVVCMKQFHWMSLQQLLYSFVTNVAFFLLGLGFWGGGSGFRWGFWSWIIWKSWSKTWSFIASSKPRSWIHRGNPKCTMIINYGCIIIIWINYIIIILIN